jgi:hypothetical protein
MSTLKEEKLWTRFIPIIGLVVAVLIPLLQSNGVEVNWWASGIAYVLLAIVGVWSFLVHAIPNKSDNAKWWSAVVFGAVILGIGSWATGKQWVRDHTDNLNIVRVSDVEIKTQEPGSVYLTQIEMDNRGDRDIKGDLACVIAKPNMPLKPFGVLGADSDKEVKIENDIFQKMDAEEKELVPLQDIPADKTQYGYCPSSWIPDQDEIKSLEKGDFVLYVAGRVRIPSKRNGFHIDVDFCRSGDEKHGLQNCFGHNVPHLHRN